MLRSVEAALSSCTYQRAEYMTGQRVAHYELLESLGVGAVGAVYRGRDGESGQTVAIKLLHDNPKNLVDVQRRFIREVAVLEKLDHPNVVRYYDCGIHDGRFYLAMEHVDCGTLKEVLRGRETLPWRDAVDVAVQVCSALEAAHAGGVIHRDLKPANLFLSGNGLVKVGDFGLARDEEFARLTEAGTTVGTCRYMPPEQIMGEEKLTGAVDLYALGCVLFEMLVGRPPFAGTTLVMVFEKHMFEEPENPANLLADCPADLGQLVLRLLAKEPLGRPANAGIMKKWLQQITAGQPVDWETTVRIAPTAPKEEPTPEPPPPSEVTTQNLTERLYGRLETETTGPNWRVAALGLVLLVIVIAVAIWLNR